MSNISDIVRAKPQPEHQGVVFGISAEDGARMITWFTPDCCLSVHWDDDALEVVKEGPKEYIEKMDLVRFGTCKNPEPVIDERWGRNIKQGDKIRCICADGSKGRPELNEVYEALSVDGYVVYVSDGDDPMNEWQQCDCVQFEKVQDTVNETTDKRR